MAKKTTLGVSHKTKGKFELAKERYYGEDIADEIKHGKFIEDLCDEVINDN